MRQVIILQADQYVIHFYYVLLEIFGIIYPFVLDFNYLHILYQYLCVHIYYVYIYFKIFYLSVHQ